MVYDFSRQKSCVAGTANVFFKSTAELVNKAIDVRRVAKKQQNGQDLNVKEIYNKESDKKISPTNTQRVNSINKFSSQYQNAKEYYHQPKVSILTNYNNCNEPLETNSCQKHKAVSVTSPKTRPETENAFRSKRSLNKTRAKMFEEKVFHKNESLNQVKQKAWGNSKFAEYIDKKNFKKKFVGYLSRQVSDPNEFLRIQHLNKVMKTRVYISANKNEENSNKNVGPENG